jgi:hypothetical protein
MTIFAADRSIPHTIVAVCIILAMLALPFMGVLHCQVMQDDHGHAALPLAEACCVFLCFTALVGMLVLAVKWLTLVHSAINLKPVRLPSCPIRWVPPPRSIVHLS